MNSQTKTARVVLVDDHPGVLRQVSQLLADDFDVAAALEDGTGLASAVAKYQPDLVVLDITLPDANGIELAAKLLREDKSCKVVFLTVHDDPDYASAAFAAGAMGYVVKERLATDLIPALHAALEGRRFISPWGKLVDLDTHLIGTCDSRPPAKRQ